MAVKTHNIDALIRKRESGERVGPKQKTTLLILRFEQVFYRWTHQIGCYKTSRVDLSFCLHSSTLPIELIPSYHPLQHSNLPLP